MWLVITPLNFTLVLSYFLFFVLMVIETDVFGFWFFIELASLFFVGLSLCSFVRGFTGLLIYFLVQSVSSLILLVGLGFFSEWLCTFSLILKLGLFPFMFWYLPVVYSFRSFSLFLVLTFQKIPLILIFSGFCPYSGLFRSYVVLLSSIVAGFFGGVCMLTSLDLRVLLIIGSFSGTSWLFFSRFSFLLFLLFFVFYSISLFMLLNESFLLTKVTGSGMFTFFLLLRICGLPPFPIF